ncbi:CmcJ/NvfI family oxidoreductase [Roseococcus pinisoli]|uniref:Methyltransferase n=1 Tax=Roseococcus pinisoli TaxID=2835040 RepID=A0ABS5QJ99_9PROT|nr:CmcJ/NvfI family oxidoreductase [Roseococcus pinisoli]MBS7813726.1 hypothetical protein [Roseococcus pinisoli]
MPDGYVLPPLLQTAPLNYLRDGIEQPTRYATTPPPGVPVSTIEVEPRDVLVENGRHRQHEFTLDGHGFALIDAPSKVPDLYDEAAIRRDYYPEVASILRAHLGASRVVVFDHNIRNAARAAADAALREPAKRVHNDYTYASAPQRLRDLLPEEADRLLAGRFAIVNLWRPLKPVQESPLALAEWSSIAEEDLVPTSLVYADRVGETFSVRHSPRHAWVYFPYQLPNEALLIKCYDSATDGRARLSFHGAFDDPSSPPDAPPRESIEARTLVFWD